MLKRFYAWGQQGGQHHLVLSIEITDLEKLRNFYLGQYLVVIPYPTFMKHINFDAKAQLSVKGSMESNCCGGLVMRMDTHLDQTWNQSICVTQRANIYLEFFFFPAVLSEPKALALPENQSICFASLYRLRYVNIMTVFVNILFWRNLAEFLTWKKAYCFQPPFLQVFGECVLCTRVLCTQIQ